MRGAGCSSGAATAHRRLGINAAFTSDANRADKARSAVWRVRGIPTRGSASFRRTNTRATYGETALTRALSARQ